jgi:GNAT superfamily N-acetyltransferase
MPSARIAECRAEELDRLEAAIPSGASRFHQQRYNRQQLGTSTYLIAWVHERPVGHAEMRWNGGAAEKVRQRFPRCPEISALDVWPAQMRSRGIGTALIVAAERLATGRKVREIGLGVADENPRAAALYLRLGFAETGCRYVNSYEIVKPTGMREIVNELCRFLVKNLDVSYPRPRWAR